MVVVEGNDPSAFELSAQCSTSELNDYYSVPVSQLFDWLSDIHDGLLHSVVRSNWWAGAVTIHSLKDGFYRPTAETISFTYPKLAVPHAVGTNVLDIHCDLS